MFLNNLKIALRALRKNRLYSFVTLVGLTVGFGAVMLLFQMVYYELSFNRHFQNYDRIVRVVQQQRQSDGQLVPSVCTPIPAMDAIEQTVSQFEYMSRLKEIWVTLSQPDPNGGPPLKKIGMQQRETALFVEPSFFQIFNLNWLAGDPLSAVSKPDVIVLSEREAAKFYDSPESALGQILVIDNLIPVTVTGVYKDLPDNCDFNFPFLSSWLTLKAHRDYFFYDDEWGSCSSNNQVYALLKDPGQFEAANSVLAKVGEKEYLDRNQIKSKTHMLQPLSDLHFNEDYQHSGDHQISRTRLRILSGIGVLILFMACFNFINLATAQSVLRAKEVGVRKTLGGARSQLITQFMSETAILVLVSAILGIILAAVSTPMLKYVSDMPEDISILSEPEIWIFLMGIVFIVTILAGLYPALSITRFQPVAAMRSLKSQSGMQGTILRKSLVVLQFLIAQGLIIGALITLQQLDYIRSRDLGFSKDQVFSFNVGIDSSSLARQQALKQELLKIPTVMSVSFSSDQPLSGNTWANNFRYGSRSEDENFDIHLKFCDADYQETYGMQLMTGKWYEPSDTIRQCVVNQTLLRRLGISDPSEVVGQKIFLGSRKPIEITGVVKDFHTHSLHREMAPLLLTTRKDFYWEIGVKMETAGIGVTLSSIENVFNRVMPEQVFDGMFLDERFERFYEDDNRLAATCKGFGLLAILISCLGLFGLAAHAAQQRVKEIGIRKVLGATTAGVVGLLTRDFLKLVLIALVLASPLAWYLMNQWLEDFAYRIDIHWFVFFIAGLLVCGMAFFTVGFQGLKAAWANPVDSLRSE